MKSLLLETIYTQPIDLPIAYNHLLQGAFYAIWERTRPSLHDLGADNAGGMRLFVFSPISGNYHIEGGRIRFFSPVRLELRSAADALIEDAASSLARSGRLWLGGADLSLASIQIREELLFPSQAHIRMQGPLVVYDTFADGRTHYFAPDEDEWEERLRANLQRKMEALDLPIPDHFQISPFFETLRKRVTRFKGTYITGYTGDFLVHTSPEAMKVLYYAGLGSRGSQGCGLFDIRKI